VVLTGVFITHISQGAAGSWSGTPAVQLCAHGTWSEETPDCRESKSGDRRRLATGPFSALSAFEWIGTGDCASSGGLSSYFWRATWDAFQSSGYLEGCAQDARQAGAQAFQVDNSGRWCQLVPHQHPGLSDHARCTGGGGNCPARSPYGCIGAYEYDEDYDYDGEQDSGNDQGDNWQWMEQRGGVSPVSRVDPHNDDSNSLDRWDCYRAHPGCCSELTAMCLSCQYGVSLLKYCEKSPSTDGCECAPSNGDWSCCSSTRPCQDDFGDCDNDSDCVSGSCLQDVGKVFGARIGSFDVCGR